MKIVLTDLKTHNVILSSSQPRDVIEKPNQKILKIKDECRTWMVYKLVSSSIERIVDKELDTAEYAFLYTVDGEVIE